VIVVDEVIFWGIAYAFLLASAGAYIVVLWRGLDVAALVGRLMGAVGAVLAAAGLILCLARTCRWFQMESSELAVMAAAVAVIVVLILERWGRLRGGAAGVLVLVVLLYSFALWGLVIGGGDEILSVAGKVNFLQASPVLLNAIAYGCLLVAGGIGLVRLIPARGSVAGRPPEDVLDDEAWRVFVWATSALSGGLAVGAGDAYLSGRNLWSSEAGLLLPMAVWLVCGGTVAVKRAGGWRATLATLATVVTFVVMLSGGN
jgi:hypothetical protein